MAAVPATTCPAVPLPRLHIPATEAALSAGDPITIVALGSSSTAGSGASGPSKTYPARLQQALRAAWPGASVTVLNRGIGGEVAAQTVTRIDTDVLPAKPTMVIWQVGTNDALKGIDPAGFKALLDDGLHKMATAGTDVVMMDNQVSEQVEDAPHHQVYVDEVAAEAAKRRVSLFSRWKLMLAWLRADPTADDMVGPDGLHHTDRGYACLAASLASAIEKAAARPMMVSDRKTAAHGTEAVQRDVVTR